MLGLRGRLAPSAAIARLRGAVPSRAFAADKPSHPNGLQYYISSYLMPQVCAVPCGGGGGAGGRREAVHTLYEPVCLLHAALQENTWQDKGTHHVKKKRDLFDHLAMLVGPRPDTVTSDNLRSSRSETDFRRFNPGSPVNLETDAPVKPIIPQSTGRSFTPQEVYDVSARRWPSPPLLLSALCPLPSALCAYFCDAGAERMRHQVLYKRHSCS